MIVTEAARSKICRTRHEEMVRKDTNKSFKGAIFNLTPHLHKHEKFNHAPNMSCHLSAYVLLQVAS